MAAAAKVMKMLIKRKSGRAVLHGLKNIYDSGREKFPACKDRILQNIISLPPMLFWRVLPDERTSVFV